MYCNLGWCSVAIAFIIANIYVAFTADKTIIKQQFYDTLTQEQIDKYESIIRERRDISLKGYILGLVISIIFLSVVLGFTNNKSRTSITMGVIVCVTGGITMLVNYLFYMLYPKSTYMVLDLESKAQRQQWLNIYKHMQTKYHIGLIIGIIAAMFLAKSVC